MGSVPAFRASDLEQTTLKYASPVLARLYEQNDEYFSRFQPKVHRDAQVCDDAALQLQIDLSGRERVGFMNGSMNPRVGNLCALIAPECQPEHLPLAAYVEMGRM